MENKHRKIIKMYYKYIADKIDIIALWPKLLDYGIYNKDDCNIPNWLKNITSKETKENIILTITTRGPYAYGRFIISLQESNHIEIANFLSSKIYNSS